MDATSTLTELDRKALQHGARLFYNHMLPWRRRRAPQDVDEVLARWKASLPPRKTVTVIRDGAAAEVPFERAELWELAGDPSIQNKLDLVLHLYASAPPREERGYDDPLTSLENLFDWYGPEYLISVLVRHHENAPASSLLRANAYLINSLLASYNKVHNEVRELRRRVKPPKKNTDGPKKRGEGKTKATEARKAKVVATATDILSAQPYLVRYPDKVTARVYERFAAIPGYPGKKRMRRWLSDARLFGKPRPRKRAA